MEFIINGPHCFYSKKDEFPTIHFTDENLEICCSFRLDKAEWVNNLEGEKKTKDLDYICNYLKGKDSEFPELLRYELARRIWNINNEEKPIPKMDMPNYLEM